MSLVDVNLPCLLERLALLLDRRSWYFITTSIDLLLDLIVLSQRISISKVCWNVSRASVGSNDAHWMLVGSILCPSGLIVLSYQFTASSALVIKRLRRLVLNNRYRHAFCNGHAPHFIFYSHLVLNVFLFASHYFHVFYHLLLVDLLLESCLHGKLLLLSLVQQEGLLVSTLENIALLLEIKVDSIVKYSSSNLDVWKVLLCASCIIHVLHIGFKGLIVATLIDIKRLIIISTAKSTLVFIILNLLLDNRCV